MDVAGREGRESFLGSEVRQESVKGRVEAEAAGEAGGGRVSLSLGLKLRMAVRHEGRSGLT